MSDEHTPGPWKQSGRMVVDTIGDAVAMVNIARPVANAYADAALIASAPDLAARVRELEDKVKIGDLLQANSLQMAHHAAIAERARAERAERACAIESEERDKVEAERDELLSDLSKMTVERAKLMNERDALRALLREARERETRYVLPLYRDANYMARIDAALTNKT